MSGIGKGISSSSIGVLLKASGLHVTSIKIDPYLNTDAGTMSPYEHGEVFVLDDGGEVDLDLGNYERFLDVTLTRDHNITTGKVYSLVIDRERKGDYLGKTVQVIPHITDAIQDWIERVAHIAVDGSKSTPDVCIVELGGTVGDIESSVFLEALRQFRYKVGQDNFCHVHVSLVPVVGGSQEQKSKPTQHGVKELRAVGLQPDIILCRSTAPLSRATRAKISQFCMVPDTHVVSVHDVSNIFKVPLLMLEQRVPSLVMGTLRINRMSPEDIPQWRAVAEAAEAALPPVRIGIVGKYTGLSDSYLSVTKALQHAAVAARRKLVLEWVDSSLLELPAEGKTPEQYAASWAMLKSLDGILVPGGFGDRGIEGKILAIKWARENKVPFFGICMGLQVAVIEYCRSVLGIKDATSAEFDPHAAHPVVLYMPEISTTHMGGTMRLGSRRTVLKEGTIAHTLYGAVQGVDERHRHRYEVNPEYVDKIQKAGLIFSGRDERNQRMECVELPSGSHPYFFAVQYHPEFLSRPLKPSPPFLGLVKAAAAKADASPSSASEPAAPLPAATVASEPAESKSP